MGQSRRGLTWRLLLRVGLGLLLSSPLSRDDCGDSRRGDEEDEGLAAEYACPGTGKKLCPSLVEAGETEAEYCSAWTFVNRTISSSIDSVTTTLDLTGSSLLEYTEDPLDSVLLSLL